MITANCADTRSQVATQPSIWDSEHIEDYKELYIHPEWENRSAFDPSCRWTFREENQVRRKVDWKIMVRRLQIFSMLKGQDVNSVKVWVCVMFAALNIDRSNISNAVSDNMLDDLGLTPVDYVSTRACWILGGENIPTNISRV